ncbi:MAG: AAA family ATPase [Rhizobiaceae bacterium]
MSGNVKTKTLEGQEYSAADMSDGERVVFYLIAQALLEKPDSLLIFDEPELHINRSILAKLWDEIEGARAPSRGRGSRCPWPLVVKSMHQTKPNSS